jgi:hypothetical protein
MRKPSPRARTSGLTSQDELVGHDPNAAIAAKLRREHVLAYKNLGIQVIEKDNELRTTLTAAVERFLIRLASLPNA